MTGRQRVGRNGLGTRMGAVPPGRMMKVRSVDGTILHTEIFGPEDGYPIVLCHGITCAIRVWANQIADLCADHRVIAFDHRGHGRSGIPRDRASHKAYSLDLLAADLKSVLDATLNAHERAVIAGHSMGGIAITSWADRYRDEVAGRADAVALINTTTGDLLRELKLIPVPALLAGARVWVAHNLLNTFGPWPVPLGARWTSRLFVAAMAVGADADPAIARFVHELFAATPAAGRGGCVKMLADALGPNHLSLDGLVVPTLVIGSEKDRLLPIGQSRRIAEAVPNLAALVELSGGHCAILEQPGEVNRLLRELVVSTTSPGRPPLRSPANCHAGCAS